MWCGRVRLKNVRASRRLSSSIACIPRMAGQGLHISRIAHAGESRSQCVPTLPGDQLLRSSPGILLQQLGEGAVGELGACALLVRREVKEVGQQPCGVYTQAGPSECSAAGVLSPTARRQPNGDGPTRQPSAHPQSSPAPPPVATQAPGASGQRPAPSPWVHPAGA